MKEKELTKICDYTIERYYQEGDYFIDIEYHGLEGRRQDLHSDKISHKVNVYVGDKTDINYGIVMELASFNEYGYDLESKPLLDSIEKTLGRGLCEYNFFKRHHFQSELEDVEDEEPINWRYCYCVYEGEWNHEIQKEVYDKLNVERYKYGKYIFDFVKHKDPEDGSYELEIYIFKEGSSSKLLCDKCSMDSESIDIDYFTSDHLYIYKLAYKNPWQIRLLIPDFEKTFDKSYHSSDNDSYDDSDSYEDDMCCYNE